MELELQHCVVHHDSKLCSRLDRFLSCFEPILSHGSPFHCEALCILGISVASVVLLLFQENRRIVLVRQASNPHREHNLENFWSSDHCSNFRSYSCTRSHHCCALVECSALERTGGISTFSKSSGAAGFSGALIHGVRPALGPLRHPKTRNGLLFGLFFFVGMGPYGRSWGSKFRCRSQMSNPFLGLGLHFGSKKS